MSAHFPRPTLADQMVAATSGADQFNDASAGLVLIAPPRTGTTAFFRRDLIPAFHRAGVAALHIALGACRGRDIPKLFASKLEAAMRGSEWTNLTAAPNGPVALIIDDVHQALTSRQGEALMLALKTAKDEMNIPGEAGLRVVLATSDQDKVAQLTATPAAPFHRALIKEMPTLGAAYVDHVASQIESAYPALAPLNRDKLTKTLQMLRNRPGEFTEAYREALDPTSDLASICKFEERIDLAARWQIGLEASQYDALFLGLSDVERAVVARMLAMQDAFRPMDADAITFYEAFIGREITTNRVNSALQRLRENSPPIVWKSTRGDYAIADAGMHGWHFDRVASGRWPPGQRDSADSIPP